MEHLTNGIACQSNKLVEARYSLTPNEQKIIIMMVAMISPDDKDFKEYEIRIADFAQLLNIQNNKLYKETKNLLYRLASRTLLIEDDNGFLIASWVSSAKYIKATGTVTLCFDKNLKPYLLQLKREFTKLNLFTIVQFRSNYTIRIYMLLKQYERIGKREFDLTDFREKLQITNKYKKFKDLRKRVINQAKKELDKKDKQGHFISDISFEFEPIKRGRSVTRLRFVIFQNKHEALKDPDSVPLIKSEIPALEKSSSDDLSPALKQLIDFGVAGATAEAIIKKHSAEYIQEKLQLTTEEDRHSPVGFFVKALENDYKSKKLTQKKLKTEQKNKALAKEQQEKHNKLIAELSEEYGHITRKQFLDSLTEAQTKELTRTLTQLCKDNNRFQGLQFLEAGLELEYNPHVFDYIDASIPNFEERRHEYITSRLMKVD